MSEAVREAASSFMLHLRHCWGNRLEEVLGIDRAAQREDQLWGKSWAQGLSGENLRFTCTGASKEVGGPGSQHPRQEHLPRPVTQLRGAPGLFMDFSE